MTKILFILVLAVGVASNSVFSAQNQNVKRAIRGGQNFNKPTNAPPGANAVLTNNATTDVLIGPNPYESQNIFIPETRIDEIVFKDLKKRGIQPASLCSDAVFVRRVYLDITGTIPSAYEAREFLFDRSPNKRARLIDKLLEREEYVDYYTMKWCDILRVKAEFPINLWPNAVQAYHRWIRDCIKANLPYDEFVREMLVSNGSNFRDPQVNFYRAVQSKTPEGIAKCVALTFMGVRPERLTDEQIKGLAGFFSKIGFKSTTEWKEEIVFFDPFNVITQGTTVVTYKPVFPDGTVAKIPQDTDPRIVFANWLTNPKNPWFTKNIANRIWYWLMGRGIIHEPDDIRPDNPPSNPELLEYLEKELIAHKYDMKYLMKLILNSRVYQLSSIPATTNKEAAKYFAYYPIRRLEAEVLIDAINKITSTTEKYMSEIPEPFSFIPEDIRAVCIADGSITSPFLELFGRPSRDTGLLSERNNRFTASQRLHLLNSSHILRKLDQSKMVQFQLQGNKSPREIISNIYLGILSRLPTEKEMKTAEGYFQKTGQKREATIDIAWSLINSSEFLFRH
jgi:hypothetical protein